MDERYSDKYAASETTVPVVKPAVPVTNCAMTVKPAMATAHQRHARIGFRKLCQGKRRGGSSGCRECKCGATDRRRRKQMLEHCSVSLSGVISFAERVERE
jgi:hypothetical protein